MRSFQSWPESVLRRSGDRLGTGGVVPAVAEFDFNGYSGGFVFAVTRSGLHKIWCWGPGGWFPQDYTVGAGGGLAFKAIVLERGMVVSGTVGNAFFTQYQSPSPYSYAVAPTDSGVYGPGFELRATAGTANGTVGVPGSGTGGDVNLSGSPGYFGRTSGNTQVLFGGQAPSYGGLQGGRGVMLGDFGRALFSTGPGGGGALVTNGNQGPAGHGRIVIAYLDEEG